MADWFRFYSDALDEPRFQYALHRQPEVMHAWVWLLCECSRHHRDTVRTLSNSHLLGLSHKLAVNAGKLSTAFKILEEIEYIEKTPDGYKVRKWNDLQSEYMQKKRRRESGHCQDTIRTKPEIVRLEERRREKNIESPPDGGTVPDQNPTLEDCIQAATSIGMTKKSIEAFFHHFNAVGWIDAQGRKIKSLSSALAKWKANESNHKPKGEVLTRRDEPLKDNSHLEAIIKEACS